MARPRLILLIRHGESEGNCDKSVNRFTANHKISLTEKGNDQARMAGIKLRSMLNKDDSLLFYTSPYQRARQTLDGLLEGIKDTGLSYDVHEEPRMREQDFGNFQSTPEEMEKIWQERAHYGHFFYRIPHGESAADVYDRCAGFNETLFRQFHNENFPSVLVLVTHGIWARVFLMKWFRWTYEEFESLRNIPHCQFLVMEKNENNAKYQLKTPLKTWDDLSDHEIDDEEIEKEYKDEVCFNSNGKMSSEEISNVLKAEREALQKLREKDKKIKRMFKASEQEKGKFRDH